MTPLPRFFAAGEARTDLLTTGPGAWTSQTGGSTRNVRASSPASASRDAPPRRAA
jgi:hypothetical protein